jgi:hypothetical protein
LGCAYCQTAILKVDPVVVVVRESLGKRRPVLPRLFTALSALHHDGRAFQSHCTSYRPIHLN